MYKEKHNSRLDRSGMSNIALVSIFCPDRTGLVASIAGCLFDLGVNLGDTSFAVLGSGAEFMAVCELPDSVTESDLDKELSRLPELAEAKITIAPFTLDPLQDPAGQITHRITLKGGDQPGLIARICEVFIEFKANIARLSTVKTFDGDYVVRISVAIPEGSATACLATIANTAEGLHMSCRTREV